MDSRLIESWRNRPEDLRRAVQASREAYQRAPKAARKLPKANYLVGESRGGTVLFGAVIASECSTAEFDAAIKQAADFIRANQGGLQAARKAGKKTRQLVRLEVFLPPDFFPDTPPSVEGVPVEWLRWVPVTEQEVRVEKLAARNPATAAGESVITRLLGHLEWWEQALRDGTGPETPYRKALLVYNAATLLEWHLTAPGKDKREHFQDAKTREKAGKVIREFIEVARECVTKTEGVTGAKAEKQLGKLAGVTERAVRKLAKLYQCQSAATPGRCDEFEKPLKPAALISAWLAANTGGAPDAVVGDRGAALAGTGAGDLVLQSLAPALAAERLFDEGKLTAEGFTAVRQTCAEFLEDAVTLAAEEAKGKKTKKHWQQLGRPAVEAFRRPVAPRFGEGES